MSGRQLSAGVPGNLFGALAGAIVGPVWADEDDFAPNPGTPLFREYDAVVITRLDDRERWWSEGADEIARAPRVGDRGLIVALHEDEGHRAYTVEVMDGDGNTICVTDVWEGELKRE